MDDIQIIILVDGTILISRISDIASELGEPDCKLINPYQIIDKKLIPWLHEFTDNIETIMISSDKILTLVDPKKQLIDNYLNLIQ